MSREHMQKRILLLDKDNELLQLVDDIMFYGFSDVCITSDCNAIYDVARSYQPDLIILDHLLANNNGNSIYQNFKHSTDFKDTPVIVISADNRVASASGYNCDEFSGQPLNSDELAYKLGYLMAS